MQILSGVQTAAALGRAGPAGGRDRGLRLGALIQRFRVKGLGFRVWGLGFRV